MTFDSPDAPPRSRHRPLSIAVALPDPPLPLGSAAARWSFCMLSGLAARGHRVTCLAGYANEAEAAEAHALYATSNVTLKTFPYRPSGRLAGRLATLIAPRSHLTSPAYRLALKEAAAGADVVHVELTWTAYAVAREFRGKTLLGVHWLAAIDSATGQAMTVRDRMLTAAMIRQERRILRAMPHLAALTPELAEGIRRIAPGAHVAVVPLGIDPSLYPYDGADPEGPPTLGFIGTISWGPTRSAAERLIIRIWPEVHRQMPEARFRMVGRGARAIAHLVQSAGPHVELYADVPDTRPHFRSLHALLYAPDHVATGAKVKVLEALLLGTPVVTNSSGAEGLATPDGEGLAVAETDEALIHHALAILRDPALRARRRRVGRDLALKASDPETSLDRLEDCYAAIVAGEAVR
jgi:glycosyltransferase involved in cell wall biosynthesis